MRPDFNMSALATIAGSRAGARSDRGRGFEARLPSELPPWPVCRSTVAQLVRARQSASETAVPRAAVDLQRRSA